MLSMLQIPIQSVLLSYNHQTGMFLLSAYINWTEFWFKTGIMTYYKSLAKKCVPPLALDAITGCPPPEPLPESVRKRDAKCFYSIKTVQVFLVKLLSLISTRAQG